MAFSSSPASFTGTMGAISAYRMRGVDKIILRQKGGASKQQIKQHPNFTLTRLNNEEWKAGVRAYQNIRTAMYPVWHLGDYNFSGHLQGVCKKIQLDDVTNQCGRRSVLLSQGQYKLEGFGLNRYHSFESMLRHPIDCTLNRGDGLALISLPDILPGVNLQNPKKQPMYRLVFSLGAVADIVYNELHKMYLPVATELPQTTVVYTPWQIAHTPTSALELTLVLQQWADTAGVCLLLAAGIEYGVPDSAASVKYVKYSGSARLLKMV